MERTSRPVPESRLLLEAILAAYRDINPDMTDLGAHLCRKLADGLYERGARIQIGNRAPVHLTIHQSLDPLGHIVWTCKKWNEVLGYKSREAVGKHISEILTPDSYAFMQEFGWPGLLQYGHVEGGVTMIRKTGEV